MYIEISQSLSLKFSSLSLDHSLNSNTMASAAAAITAALSSLSVRPLPRHGLVLKPLQTISPSSSYCARLRTLPKLAAKGDADTSSFDDIDPEDDDIPLPDFDELPPETDEEIAAAYEELYGPAYSGVSVLGDDINIMDRKLRASRRSQEVLMRPEDSIEERLVQMRRVTKVVKGGMNINFRAVVVVGDMQGHVGVGVGKAGDSDDAIIKASINGRRNMITVPLTKHNSFPHRADGKYGAAVVMLRPARPGSGVNAGGSVRDVLELAGIQNALGKQLGSKNPLNNARATLAAIKKMRLVEDIARERGVSVQHVLGRE